MKNNTIAVSVSSLSDARRALSQELAKNKLSSKEITLGVLLMEEMFFRLKKGMEGGEDFSVQVSARRIWGQTSIRMEAKGSEYNPVPEVTEQEKDDVDEEEVYRLAILKSNRQKLSCVRKNGSNIVTIKVQGLDSTKKQLIYTVSALVLGSVCGLAMQVFLDGASIAAVNDSFISPVRNLFLNALHMMMAPVTFFAIIAGVTNISDASLIGKLGGKMVMVSLFMQVLIALLGLGLGLVIFTGNLTYIQAGITSSGEVVAKHVSLVDMLFDIVPKNLVDPFKGDNILQVMFLAVFFGIIINQMGEKAKGAIDSIDFVFRFVIAVLKFIVKAVPLVVFLSMASLLASTGMESLVAFSGLFGGLVAGVLIVWAVCALAILLFGRLSPVPAIKKIAGSALPISLLWWGCRRRLFPSYSA